MGTTLTGTTPQDTYDSLIKVTDNGPISGTLKALSDGLGNDSALALSTGAASITGNLTASGASSAFTGGALEIQGAANAVKTFYLNRYGVASGSQHIIRSANAHLLIATANSEPIVLSGGSVGIGTSAPIDTFQVNGGISVGSDATANNRSRIYESFGLNIEGGAAIDRPLVFRTNLTERMKVTFDGYLRLASTSSGIQFNGDTAAANALDDYEEGTWTMGVSFGGASVGVTASANTGTYTKIGRQVTVNGLIILTSKGNSTGNMALTGLPFTIANTTGNYASASYWMANVSFANQFMAIGEKNTTRIDSYEITEAGTLTNLNDTNFANNSEVILSLTYFV